MIAIRKSEERGHANHGWLDTYHTFSFDTYHDERFMGFRSLRVINEDRVAAGKGFGMHFHRDMEIITWILEGALEHRDSLGTGSIIRPGEAQRMTAGSGIQHSEFNPSPSEPVHLIQIWILPEKRGLPPSYEQKRFAPEEARGRLRLIAGRSSQDGGAVSINQDAALYTATLAPGEEIEYRLAAGRHAWVQVTRGSVELNGNALKQGDGAAVSEEEKLSVRGASDAQVLLFDLA